MLIGKAPALNLKAVLRETGIAADTLRAWERRYGLPLPQRTAGGHRLYSEYDVETIRWLIARQNEGFSISRAVELWKEIHSQGRDPFAELPARRPAPGLQQSQQSIYPPPETSSDALHFQWLEACLGYNESAAEQVLNQAFGMYPVEMVCVEVLQRGMVEIGNLWHENRASVQQEHFASGLAMRRLDSLFSSAPPPTRPQTILVGCPPDEWHTFTPLLLSLFLRRRGFKVIYLGANVPAVHFEETIAAVQTDLVVLASQQLTSAATLLQTALLLSDRGRLVAYGGRIFLLQPGIVKTIPGHFLGNKLDTAVEHVESLLAERPDSPRTSSPSKEYISALREFAARRLLIEATINEGLNSSQQGGDYFGIANQFLGNNILAALHLGNMDYLDSEIDWLVQLIKAHNLPVRIVYDYLGLYGNAVSGQLAEQGKPIIEWLNRQLKQRS